MYLEQDGSQPELLIFIDLKFILLQSVFITCETSLLKRQRKSKEAQYSCTSANPWSPPAC